VSFFQLLYSLELVQEKKVDFLMETLKTRKSQSNEVGVLNDYDCQARLVNQIKSFAIVEGKAKLTVIQTA
jgi:UDP-N-acetylglucosamine pyrophosphorylase